MMMMAQMDLTLVGTDDNLGLVLLPFRLREVRRSGHLRNRLNEKIRHSITIHSPHQNPIIKYSQITHFW